MLNEREIESCYLGQFIPVHYHHNMLMDQTACRVQGGHRLCRQAGRQGAGAGRRHGRAVVVRGRQGGKVYCVEFNPDMVQEARRFLALNPNGEKVEVIHADAFEYLPPEPVDVVICEMIHVGMLRENRWK
jgi:predicted RNA methylase